VQATPGASRVSVMREIIAAWVERKCHEASLIHRVRSANGTVSESGRKRGGNGAG
jgi:hypothetical protein